MLLSVFVTPVSLAQASDNTEEYDGYIVKLSEPDADSVRLMSTTDMDVISEEHSLYRSDGGAELFSLVESGLVEYAEPNYKVYLLGTVDDPYYPQQWNLIDIGIDDAWDYGINGEGVRVAIIDSGINARHEDFEGSNILNGVNVIDSNNDVADQSGHGTFVSGVIAATRDNGKGIAGITDGVEIVPIKCFEDSDDTNISYVVSALYAAVDQYSCDVINLSLGMQQSVRSFKDAIDYASSSGAILISSVGNYGTSTLFYPAAYDNVIGVGSAGKNGELCDFSQYNSSVFVTAPGESIYSLSHTSNNKYMVGAGTSFSTPHVSSLAIMAKCYNTSIGVEEFKKLLIDSSADRGPQGYDVYFGHGYIEADLFVKELTKVLRLTAAGTNPKASVALNSVSEIDMSDWFFGNGISYSLYATTAYGKIDITGSKLTFSPSAADAEKSIRIIVGAELDNEVSPEKAVLTVSVTDPNSSTAAADKFSDMKGHWAKKHVAFGVSRELLSGLPGNVFEPDSVMNRAMFTTLLARLSGEEYTETENSFSDVSQEDWYAGAVTWASQKGIVSGYDNGKFGALDSVTREQLAVFLYRYAVKYNLTDGKYDSNALYGFTDFVSVSTWAKEAVGWAVANGLVSGRTTTTIAPGGTATRAETAGILERFYRTFY